MIENFKKLFYHSCVTQYNRLIAMVKLFQLKASNGWGDYSFEDLLMLLKDSYLKTTQSLRMFMRQNR
jgi:hypothetical protein